jgi:hypothetical protein
MHVGNSKGAYQSAFEVLGRPQARPWVSHTDLPSSHSFLINVLIYIVTAYI